MEQLGYVTPRCVDVVMERIRPPEQVLSKKYLVILLLFSQTCETICATLIMREQLITKLGLLSGRHITPEIQRRINRLNELVISQDRNVESQRLLLDYRSQILLDILDGKEPNSRYT